MTERDSILDIRCSRRQWLLGALMAALAPSLAVGACGPILSRASLGLGGAFRTAQGEHVGFNFGLMRALGREVGREVVFVDETWNKSLTMMARGSLHLLAEVTYKPERTRFLDYLIPHEYERHVLLVNTDMVTQPIDSFERLAALPAPVQMFQQTAYPRPFERRLEASSAFAQRFVAVASRLKSGNLLVLRETAARLLSGRLAAAIIDHRMAAMIVSGDQPMLQGLPRGKLKVEYSPLFPTTLNYLTLSKAAFSLSERYHLRQALLRYRQSEAFMQLWHQWYPKIPMPEISSPVAAPAHASQGAITTCDT